MDDSNVVLTPDASAKLQDESAAVLPQAPDLIADASQRAIPTDVTIGPPTSLTTTPSSKPSSGALLERLWNHAYNGLRTEEESTVLAYETLLLKRLKELNKGSPLPASTQITPATLAQPEQLEKFVSAGLEESKKIATTKENVKEFGRVAQQVKAVMDVVVQAAPQAALAWSCVSFALQVCPLGFLWIGQW